MRIYFGLVAYQTPSSGVNLPYAGQVVGGAIVPDDWTGIRADPRFSVSGDGVEPVNGQTPLSFQPGGGLQARKAGTAGAWEVVAFGGGFFAIDPDGHGLVGPFPYVQVS